ncbi:hypothetical protein Goe19_02150 [Bacillus phage vB_BsuM-Goe19]|nr:hypothetical protein Goe19_00190 [Bacillus phage vB_BsuM-Goe19]WCS68856.1 hypothetical protein Goe19_02150 [Bacillus phage vB_BsuM-Goe19]
MAKINKGYVANFIEENGFPEQGHFEEKKDLQAFYKHLSTEQLEEWVELEGLEVKDTDSDSIYRMRLCMAILYLNFPKKTTGKKKESPYKHISLEELVKMATDNDIEVKHTDSDKILRMRTIMALKEAGKLG